MVVLRDGKMDIFSYERGEYGGYSFLAEKKPFKHEK